MSVEFSRTALLIGDDGIEKLKCSKVAVFGVGGVGSFAVEALARVGVGSLMLCDNDIICRSNINRQLIALHSTIGEYKVDVLSRRILDINKNAKITAKKIFVSRETIDEFDFSSYDYIIDAIDTVSAKLLLVEKAAEHNVPIISSMGAGNKLDATAFEVTDIFKTSVCPLARVMRLELKKRNINKLKVVYSKEQPLKPLQKDGGLIAENEQNGECDNLDISFNTKKRQTPGSISFVPSVAGLIVAGEVIKDLLKQGK